MIVGFNVDSLNAEKKSGAPQGNLQVNYSSQITDVLRAEVGAMDGEVAKINFEFTVSYTVADSTAAEIVMEGNILWSKDVTEVIDHWEENQALPPEVNKPLMNDLYRKCISQSVGVADTLGLVPPVPTPRIEE